MNQVITPVKKLLVIDNQVGNWQSLAADVGTDTAVLILDSGSDGLTQISAYLTTLAANTQNFVPLQSLQIISHGSAGSISLGSTTLTADNLQQYTSQLTTIGNALTATGDILLYGCNVAADPVGLDFINQFAALTSADVAASTDLTGATALGGNWVLEAATGTIEAIALQPVYNGVLLEAAGAVVINFNKGEAATPQVESTAGNLGMTQSAYAGFANVAPQAGGLTAGINAAGAYYEDGMVVGIVEDTSNGIAHVHRGGTTNDRNVMYHSDSSGLYIRALDSTAFSLTSLNFDASAGDENPYATGTYISQSSGDSVTSVAGANNYWEILGYASALNPTLDTDANSGAYIARQIVTNGFNGVLTLDSAFHNIGAFWIHYAGYQQTPTDGMQFAMSLDNVNIAPVNTAPVAVDDNLTATEDTLIIYTAAQLLGNDTDVEGDTLIIASVISGNNGTAVLNADGTVSFTSFSNFNGVADFSYVASDGKLLSTSATVTVTVVNVNDAPTTSAVTLASILEHSQARVITQAELLGNAVDLDGNTLTATNLSLASSNGTLVDNADGTWSYTPLLNDVSSVSFNYTITDSVSPTAGTVAATATLAITPVELNAEPVADLFKSFGNGTNEYITPEAYVQNAGQNLDLKYQIIDKSADAVIIGSTSNDFIKLAGTGNKAANGGGGNDVLDGSTGSSFLSGGDGINTFFLDGRAAGVTWSTLTDFTQGQDKATIWGWVKGVSSINAGFTDFNTGGATDYTGLTLHIQNLLPEGSVSGATNSALNSLTLTGHTLAQFGASSLADLNTQIINGTNTHFIVGQITDNLGVHDYLLIS